MDIVLFILPQIIFDLMNIDIITKAYSFNCLDIRDKYQNGSCILDGYPFEWFNGVQFFMSNKGPPKEYVWTKQNKFLLLILRNLAKGAYTHVFSTEFEFNIHFLNLFKKLK